MSDRELTVQSGKVAFAATFGLLTSAPTVAWAPAGLFLEPITKAFGIGRADFAVAMALSSVTGAFAIPYTGRLIDRFGIRRIVLPGLLLFAGTEILLSQIPGKLWAYVAVLVLQGLCAGAVSPLGYTKAISLWFHRRRGIVLALASAIGIGGGPAITAQIAGALLERGGWREAYFGLGLYAVFPAWAIIFFMLREPDRKRSRSATKLPLTDRPGLTRAEAFKTRAFWLIVLAMFLNVGSLVVLMFNGPALFHSRMLEIGPAFLSTCALGSMTGQLTSGLFLDRINSPKVGLPFAVAAFAGSIVILNFGYSSAVVIPAAFITGLGQGAEVGISAYYISRFCGMKAYGELFGIVSATAIFVSGVAPIVSGAVFDHTGSYNAIIPFVEVMMAGAILTILLLPAYKFAARPTKDLNAID